MVLKVNENVVVEDDTKIITVRHLKLEGNNFEIGQKIANLAKDRHQIQKTPETNNLKIELQNDYIKKNYPDYYERMKGFASVYNVCLEDNAYDFSVIGKYISNLGCSAIFYPSSLTIRNHNIVSRNEDFLLCSLEDTFKLMINDNIPENSKSALSEIYILEMYPDNSYPSISIISFEAFGECLSGVNSQGLIVTHLADQSINIVDLNRHFSKNNSSCYQIGLNCFLSLRYLLDTCSNVVQAKKALLSLKKYFLNFPVQLMIADRHGQSFVWENSLNDCSEYITENNNHFQIVSNFPLHKYKSIEELPAEDYKASPFERYKLVYNLLKNHSGKFDLNKIKQINSCLFVDESYLNIKFPYPFRTLWHEIYDADESSLEISFYLHDSADNNQIRSDYYKFSLQ